MGSGGSSQVAEELTAAIKRNDVHEVRKFLTKLATAKKGGPDALNHVGGDRKILKALQELDLSAPLTSGKCSTPLQIAASCGGVEVLRELLSVSTPRLDVNVRDSVNWTALHYAAAANCPPRCMECVNDLLAGRADPFGAGSDGFTALDVARGRHNIGCISAIEDNVGIWQGWVDHEERVLFIPTWKAKWLVVLRDRRPNSGTTRTAATSLRCYGCSAILSIPMYAAEVHCACGARNFIAVSLQFALYQPDNSHAASSSRPATATISERMVVPNGLEDRSAISTKILDDPTFQNAASDLLKGNLRRSLQSSVASARRYGVAIKITDAYGQIVEHSIRLETEAQRDELIRIFDDPVAASYRAACIREDRAAASTVGASAAAAAVVAPAAAAVPPQAVQQAVEAQAAAAERCAAMRQPNQGGRGSWSCERCTFRHEGPDVMAKECVMCGGPPPVQPLPDVDPLPPASAPPLQENAVSSSTSAPPVVPIAAPSQSEQAQISTPPMVVQAMVGSNLEGERSHNAVNIPTTAQQPPGGDDQGCCTVCLERPSDSAVIPCGHMCGCNSCLEGIKSSSRPECPICRGPVRDVIRIFRS